MTSIYEAEILDAHMHLWDLTHGDYPWLKQSNPVVTKWIGSYKKICKNSSAALLLHATFPIL